MSFRQEAEQLLETGVTLQQIREEGQNAAGNYLTLKADLDAWHGNTDRVANDCILKAAEQCDNYWSSTQVSIEAAKLRRAFDELQDDAEYRQSRIIGSDSTQ